MNLFCLTIVFVVLIIQTYTDAVFVAPFGHHGHPSHHPMKPHFFGPPMHGPHIAHGPPIAHGFPPHMIHGHSPMLGPPMHPPFHLPRSHMGLPVPSMKPHIRHGSHDHPMHAMQKRVFHPLPHKYPKKTMIKALKHKKLYKKPRRVLLIRQRNGINMPNTNEYQRQMNRVAQSMYERGINYNNNYEINRYNNNNYIYNNYNNNNNIGRLNFNDRSFRNQGGNNANSPQFNARNWDIVTNGGNPGRHGNNFGNNRDLYPPRLREVVDSSNRVEISKNSLKSKHVSGSARKQSSRRSKERNNSNSLSGNTIDLTGSTFKSPNNNIGRDILSSNYLDKSSSGVQIERVNIRHDQIKSGTKRTDISSKVTRLNSNNRNNNHNRNRNNSDRLNNNNRNNNNRSKNNSNRLSNNNSNKSNTKNSNNRLNNNNVNNKGKGKNINGKNNLNKSKNSNTKNSNNNNNKNIGQQNNTNNKSNHKNNNVNKNNSHRNSKNNNNNNARKSKNNNSINKKSNTNKSNSQNNNKNKNNNNVNLSGLAGSLIDFSSMGVDASATNQNKMMNTQNSAHNTLSDKSNLSGSGTFAASSSLANSDVANNVAISSVADLNGNSINSAGNLLGASDLLLIDSNGLTPAEVAATALPIAGDALSGVVDLSTAGGNTNRIGGTNFDILTLDKGAFAQLEHALQTGQAINAKLLDSIISGGGTANNGGAFTASLASPSTAGVTDPGLAAPQIIILDHAQAQHLTGSAGIGGPQIVDLHSSSSSSKSAHSSKQASSASTSSHSVEVPHAGKVLPAGSSHLMPGSHAGGNSAGNNHGHGIVGILGEPIRAITMGSNADLMGLFSMPDASNLSNIPESVVSIPESIGRRMPSGHQHSGMTDMSSIQGSRDHRMPAGHTSHSSHSAH